MKIIKNANSKFLRNASGKLLKIRPDDTYEPNPDIFQFVVVVDDGQSISLPTLNSFTYIGPTGSSISSGTLVYDYVVDWGDNTSTVNITSYNSVDKTHVYLTGGEYLIQISSAEQKFPCFDCYTSTFAPIRLLITQVISWGNVGLKKLNFYNCTALTSLPEQRSHLTSLLTGLYFCYGCTGLSSIPYGTFFATETNIIAICDFSNAFGMCQKLRTVHSTLFKDALLVKSFSGTFGSCSKLTAIPEGLFANCTQTTTFASTFYGCSVLTQIPETLFANSPNVISFASTFHSCSQIASLPAGLFEFNSGTLCSFSSTFYNCSSIPSIPAGFFDNVKASTFSSTFYSCLALETIPEYLFRGQQYTVGFQSVFYNCRSLQGVPIGVFDISVDGQNLCTSMYQAFMFNGITSNVTDFTIASGLFDDLYKVTTFYRTFYGVAKFSVIPDGLFDNCIAVTDFKQTFYQNSHAYIPEGLFDNCTEVTLFSGSFMYNSQLVSSGIPEYLFEYNTKVINFGEPSYYGVFQYCNNVGFTTVPSTIFRQCSNVTSFYSAFMGCTYFDTIPTDLLRYNTVLSTVNQMFSGTALTSLNSNVFEYNRSITDVSSCFSNCTLLTSVDEGLFDTYQQQTNAITLLPNIFSGCTALSSIPENLFQYCVNAKILNNTFYNCTSLVSLPANLFSNNTLIENLSYCFWNCNLIDTIPSGFLNGLTQLSNITYCFGLWHSLISLPADLFNDIGETRTVDFTYCLYVQNATTTYNKYTGPVPELWNKPFNPVGTRCFYYRTAVSNYASIPSTWK